MNEIDTRMEELRALLTETLPYELPFGFTNDNLFLSELKRDTLTQRQVEVLVRLRRNRSEYTRPFSYKINRSGRSRNTLGLIHPACQIRIAKLYSDFNQTIIQSCSKSPFSIRFPAEVQRIFTRGSSKSVQKRWFLALPDAQIGQPIQEAYSSSFFGYRKYLLLDRFFSSNELVRLESRFSMLRTLDVSRCFFNIYTHSICWAMKEKDFSKKNSKLFSFEQQFDKLMQLSNYNETAGIIVGPEVSRIFAEIILQRIDVDLERLALRHGLVVGVQFAIRRYVDDYHIFANNRETLDRLELILADLLEGYKLFLNSEKSEDLNRPFITSVSRVKYEVSNVCGKLRDVLASDLKHDEQVEAGDLVQRSARSALDALRHIGGSERTALVSSMSEVFTALEASIKSLRKAFSENQVEGKENDLLARMKSIIRILFYILSVDLRVPPIIRASFVIKEIVSLSGLVSSSNKSATLAYLAFELSELLAFATPDGSDEAPLEVTNIFLLGLMVEPRIFCMQPSSASVLEKVLSGHWRGYFAILCALHACNSVADLDPLAKSTFVDRVGALILSPEFDPEVNCEDYLVFVDFLSCPAVDLDFRWGTFNKKIGGEALGKESFASLMLCLRHTNWGSDGTGFEILKRRLPPVYFSA